MSETIDNGLESAQEPPKAASSRALRAAGFARAGARLATRLRVRARALTVYLASQLGQAGENSRKRTRQGMELSFTLAREHALPRLRRSGEAIREHTRPSVIKQNYHHLLLFFHEKLFDREIEQHCFVPSGTITPLSELKIASPTRPAGRDYKPTPRLVFRWAMESIPEQPDSYTFVDFGAGRGRVLLLASHLNFERIVGVEFAEELHNDCEMNIAQYPRSLMKCRNVECVHQDATLFELPEGPSIFYFFHPFNEKLMAEMLDRITASYDHNPRRIYLVCIDMDDHPTIEKMGIFSRFLLPGTQGLKIAALSPYTVTIYRTAT